MTDDDRVFKALANPARRLLLDRPTRPGACCSTGSSSVTAAR
jgi:hypothetical protein